MADSKNTLAGLGALGSLSNLLASPTADDNTPSLSTLMALMTKPEVKGLWYNQKVVNLDGYKFIGCRFDNCHLTVASPNFELQHCHIDDITVIQYIGDIAKVVRLFTSRYTWADALMPDLVPTRHEDGTISITS